MIESERSASRVTPGEFLALVRETLPASEGFDVSFERLEAGLARMRLRYDARHVRAGGTLSGPTIMTLADTAMYALVLSLVGMEPLAVTTDLTFHFLRRPEPVDMIAEARVLRHGRRLVVGDVMIYSAGKDDPVAHATGSYALPTSASAGPGVSSGGR